MPKNTIHMIGNSHIDHAWLWRWQEGFAEIKATYKAALDRMNEYDDFIFNCGNAMHYKWVEENAPEMFKEIKSRVKEKRWIIIGGWWLQPDLNIPSGESLVRQALYGQRYFKEKFGITCNVGYNVDSFGHSAQLPQIYKKSMMDYYCFLRPEKHEGENQEDIFYWESPDKSRVLSFRIPDTYNSYIEGDFGINKKIAKAIILAEKNRIDFMCFFGVGNHGGGPTIKQLEMIKKTNRKVENELVISSPVKYFKEIEDKKNYTVYKKELQHHSIGCYSAHSKIKKINRKAENCLERAEKINVIANRIAKAESRKDELHKAWESVLFNQFHDIICGCCIKEVYEDAKEMYGEAISIASRIENESLQKISWSIDTMKEGIEFLSKEDSSFVWEQKDLGVPIVIFNTHSWDVKIPIKPSQYFKRVEDYEGKETYTQKVRATRTNSSDDKHTSLFMGEIPALGYSVYWGYKEKEASIEIDNSLSIDENTLENEYLRLVIDPKTGYIKSLYDKKNEKEVFSSFASIPIVIEDSDNDTWAHGAERFDNRVGEFNNCTIKILESGPLRATLRVISFYEKSELQIDYIMYRDSSEIEMLAKLNWQEKHKILKISFPININNPKATHEIPYGNIERDPNGQEEPIQRWVDVSEIGYGVSVINDCKYSVSILDSDIQMTVVRSTLYADHYGERDEFCEHMDIGIQEFKFLIVPHKDGFKEGNVIRKAELFNIEPSIIIETYHKGDLPQHFRGIIIEKENIIAKVVKENEDNKGVILRCVESYGEKCNTKISLFDKTFQVKFDAFEIKTFLISKRGEVLETNLLEFKEKKL